MDDGGGVLAAGSGVAIRRQNSYERSLERARQLREQKRAESFNRTLKQKRAESFERQAKQGLEYPSGDESARSPTAGSEVAPPSSGPAAPAPEDDGAGVFAAPAPAPAPAPEQRAARRASDEELDV